MGGSKDWVGIVADLAGALGFNKVRVRWKLEALRESWRGAKGRAGTVAQRVSYRHRVCPHCGNLEDRAHRACSQCGGALLPRWLEVLGRLGIAVPSFLSVSTLLTLGILLCYLRTAAAQGGGLFSMQGEVLVAFGGTVPQLVAQGEWWRLTTYIFLHAGLVHLAFNLIALQQIGPQIEEVFGRGRMLFVFMATGVAAGVGSLLFRDFGVGIGASGSLMGLIGFAAGWGQRDGTSTGRMVRDFMVKWALYVMVFGFLVGADNAAHGAGFLAGGALGWFDKPKWERKPGGWDLWLGLIGAALAVGSVWLVFVPPWAG